MLTVEHDGRSAVVVLYEGGGLQVLIPEQLWTVTLDVPIGEAVRLAKEWVGWTPELPL